MKQAELGAKSERRVGKNISSPLLMFPFVLQEFNLISVLSLLRGR